MVLEDLCRWCRSVGIVVGPGRGSGAGSLLNYGLRITHLDPIRYSLFFERFISEGRIKKGTLPDIDCLHEKTLILTESGKYFAIKELSELNVEDYPNLISYINGNLITQRPTLIFKKSFGELYKYQFDNGTYITCTKDHKVMLTSGEYIEIDEAFNSGLDVKVL